MKVTEIEAVSKSRAKVYIDEKFAFVLYKGELRSFQIREGEEVSEEDTGTFWRRCCPNVQNAAP